MEEEIEAIRKSTGLTQKAFAKRMGVPLRTYEDILSKKRARKVHLNAARWVEVAQFFDVIDEDDDDLATGDNAS